MSEIISFHKLIAGSIIPTLTTFLQVKYQTQNQFDTHGSTMLAAVLSVMVYYLLSHMVHRYPMGRFADFTQHLLAWAAYAALSTLAYALFPDQAIIFVYVMFGLLSSGEVLYMFRDKLRIEVEAERVLLFLKNRWGDVVRFFLRRPHDPILPIQN